MTLQLFFHFNCFFFLKSTFVTTLRLVPDRIDQTLVKLLKQMISAGVEKIAFICTLLRWREVRRAQSK